MMMTGNMEPTMVMMLFQSVVLAVSMEPTLLSCSWVTPRLCSSATTSAMVERVSLRAMTSGAPLR